MGTRLYPSTKDQRVLERLAGVPAGVGHTADIVDTVINAVKKSICELMQEQSDETFTRHAHWILNKISESMFDIELNLGIREYSNFLTYGYGKVNPEVCEGYAGEEKDILKVKAILDKHDVRLPKGVDIRELDGLHWS